MVGIEQRLARVLPTCAPICLCACPFFTWDALRPAPKSGPETKHVQILAVSANLRVDFQRATLPGPAESLHLPSTQKGKNRPPPRHAELGLQSSAVSVPVSLASDLCWDGRLVLVPHSSPVLSVAARALPFARCSGIARAPFNPRSRAAGASLAPRSARRTRASNFKVLGSNPSWGRRVAQHEAEGT